MSDENVFVPNATLSVPATELGFHIGRQIHFNTEVHGRLESAETIQYDVFGRTESYVRLSIAGQRFMVNGEAPVTIFKEDNNV